ncbi:hypothetical protein A4R29_04805 [Mesorhizobium ciceri biovar biserrulae]|nr:hypothetical protein A4R29_04805 [Mesorhizobium ciceri biovar biserrulae]
MADVDVKVLVDQANLCPHDAAQENFADPVVDGIVTWNPDPLNQEAFHAELGGDRCYHPGVVGLHAADGDERVGV